MGIEKPTNTPNNNNIVEFPQPRERITYLGGPPQEGEVNGGPFSPIETSIEQVDDEQKPVGSGGYGKVTREVYDINGRRVTLARKKYHLEEELPPTEIARQMEVATVLKERGIPCLEIFTNGHDIITPYLNTKGVVAIARNGGAGNVLPPRDVCDSILHDIYTELLHGRFMPKNTDELVQKICDIYQRAVTPDHDSRCISLHTDAPFFLIDTRKKEVDVLIGDFDNVQLYHSYDDDAPFHRFLTKSGLLDSFAVFKGVIRGDEFARAREELSRRLTALLEE